VLWALLVLGFVAFWLGQPSAGSSSDPADGASFWRDTLMQCLPLVLLGLALLFCLRFVAWHPAAQLAALKAQADGDFAEAEDAFARLAKRFRRFKALREFADVNRALARIHRGNLGGALDLLIDVDRRGKGAPEYIRASAACWLALAYALRGDPDAARSWRVEGDARLKRVLLPQLAATLTFVDAIVAAREGRYVEAVNGLDERWPQLEASLTARSMRPLRALHAFAAAQPTTVREAGAVSAALKAIGVVDAGELTLLTAEWPEMRAFLQGYGVASNAGLMT
jgi:ATP/maltotriose-dependent transcriptional regulator MalT